MGAQGSKGKKVGSVPSKDSGRSKTSSKISTSALMPFNPEGRKDKKGKGYGKSQLSLSLSSMSSDDFIHRPIESTAEPSFTIPSIFDSVGSENKSASVEEEEEIVAFNSEHMEVLYMQFRAEHPEVIENGKYLTESIRNMVKHLLDLYKSDIVHRYDTFQSAMLGYPSLMSKFKECDRIKCLETEEEVNAAYMHHSIMMLVTWKMILETMDKNEQKAKDLLQQLAISHGLLGVEQADLKCMDLAVTKYLLQRNLINDESIIALVAFLSTVTNEMVAILDKIAQDLRKGLSDKNHQKTKDPRMSSARVNYRWMKKWAKILPILQGRTELLKKQIKVSKPAEVAEMEDDTTLETRILKQRDCLMKHFVSPDVVNNPNSPRPSKISGTAPPSTAGTPGTAAH